MNVNQIEEIVEDFDSTTRKSPSKRIEKKQLGFISIEIFICIHLVSYFSLSTLSFFFQTQVVHLLTRRIVRQVKWKLKSMKMNVSILKHLDLIENECFEFLT